MKNSVYPKYLYLGEDDDVNNLTHGVVYNGMLSFDGYKARFDYIDDSNKENTLHYESHESFREDWYFVHKRIKLKGM